ncbi:MAG: hypothetical protein JWL59_3088 [Chthoniobacteraceae bacterium]|nr:hypothetical protein [Chthoniobacteraceae bacterium]
MIAGGLLFPPEQVELKQEPREPPKNLLKIRNTSVTPLSLAWESVLELLSLPQRAQFQP